MWVKEGVGSQEWSLIRDSCMGLVSLEMNDYDRLETGWFLKWISLSSNCWFLEECLKSREVARRGSCQKNLPGEVDYVIYTSASQAFWASAQGTRLLSKFSGRTHLS